MSTDKRKKNADERVHCWIQAAGGKNDKKANGADAVNADAKTNSNGDYLWNGAMLVALSSSLV